MDTTPDLFQSKLTERFDTEQKQITIDTTLTDTVTQTLILLNAPSLVITEADLAPPAGVSASAGESFVSGETTLWGIPATTLAMTFQGEGTAQKVGVQASMPSLDFTTLSKALLPLDTQQIAALTHIRFDHADVRVDATTNALTINASAAQWGNFLGIDGVGLSDLALVLTSHISQGGWQRDSQARLTGTLKLKSTAIPIEIVLPTGVQIWRLRVLPPGIALSSLSDIAELLVGNDVIGALPPELSQMASLTLTDMDVQFDPQKPSLASLFFSVATANRWEMLPDLALDALALGMTIIPSQQQGASAFTFYGNLSGQVSIGQLNLSVSLPIPFAGPAILQASCRQPLADFADLAGLIGGTDLSASLPAALLTGLELRTLMLSFDLSAKRVLALGIDIVVASEWSIIPDQVSIEGIELRLNVAARDTHWDVTGLVNGSINVEGTWVSIGVERLVDHWTLRLNQAVRLPGVAQLAHLVGGNDLADFLPAGMGDTVGELNLQAFSMDFDPVHSTLTSIAITIATANDWVFLPGYLTLQSLLLSCSVAQAAAGTQRQITGLVSGVIALGDAHVMVEAQKNAATAPWTFDGGLVPGTTVSLSKLMEELLPAGMTLPAEVADLSISDFALSVTPQTGACTVTARCSASWDLPFGVPGLAVSTVGLTLQRSPAPGSGGQGSQIICSLTLHGTGPVTIVDGLVFKSIDLTFDLQQQTQSWHLSGNVSASILGVDATFAASLDETPAQRTITLQASDTSATPLIDLGAIGSLTAKSFSLLITKALQPATTPASGMSMQASSPYTWSVQATGAMTVTNVFTLNGTLLLSDTPAGASLIFQPTLAQVDISLPDPLHSWTTHLGLAYLSFASSVDGQGNKTWSFAATTDTWFSGLPASMQAIAPSASSKVVGAFKATSSTVQLVVNRLTQPVAFTLPSSGGVDLGEAMIDLSNLAFTLGHDMSLSLDIGFGIPEKLNNIFGTKGDGSPVLRIFNTYVPGNPASVSRLSLHLDSSANLQLQPVTSPLKAITFASDGTHTWCNADLGEFGAFKFMVPVFRYSEGNFTGAGALTQLRPLKVPLTPLKWLLNACGLNAVANLIPDGLPLQELKIYDTQAGHFDSAALISFIEGMQVPLSSDVKTAIQAMEQQLDKLPDRFKSYLDVVLPKQFSFDLAVSSTGSIRGGLKVDPSTPIKLLYPTLGLLGPQLNGIELYGFSVGEILDGTLLQMNLDMVMDQFNLLTLIAALALPLDRLPILPRTQDLATTVTIHNLFMLIIYETVIPIPVPLFYDELALDYLGLEGLRVQTHWSFPKPSLSPADAGRVFTDFKQFFTDRQHLLDANVPPQKMDLVLTIGPNYMQLPNYLGGAALGSKEQKIVLSSYENLAHLLNALKTLSLNELVQALPLDDRVGKETVSFACMTLQVDWLITTPQEFRTRSYTRLNIVEDNVAALLQVVPPTPGKNDQGLVVFLKGTWQASTVVSLGATFGLIGSDGGFGTGLHVSGSISDWLAVDLAGTVMIDPKLPSPFGLSGHSSFVIAGRTVFTGDVQIDDQHFFMSGQLSLFPATSLLQIGGNGQAQIDRQGQFSLRTAINVALQNFVLVGATIAITNTSVEISGTWLGRTVSFLIIVQGNDFLFSGTCLFALGLNINVGPIYEKSTGLKIVDQLALNTTLNASLTITLGTAGFAADVTGSFTWNSFQLSPPAFHIAVAPQDIPALTNLLAQQIQQHASDIFATVYHTMADWLKAGVAGLVQVAAQWQSAVAAASQWSAAAWSATEQWSTQAWQSASQWDASAWNATTRWSDDAWNATTQWGDDTWSATKTWSTATWAATSTWTSDQFKDAANTATNLMHALHTDTFTPHVDVASQHVDTPATAHVDVASQHADTPASQHADVASQHADTPASPHADVASQHADTPASPHADVAAQHADTPASPHADVAAQHADTPATAHVDVASQHADTPASPHADVAAQHADTVITPHGDTHADFAFVNTHTDIARSHADSSVTPHVDTRAIPHVDATTTPHVDTKAIPHVDGAATPHVDTKAIPHVDGAATPHVDTKAIPHVDAIATPHVDTKAIPHVDAIATPHVDTKAIPHVDQNTPHGDTAARHADVTP